MADPTGFRWQLAVGPTGVVSGLPALDTLPWKFSTTFTDDFARSDRNLNGDNGWSVVGPGTASIVSGQATTTVGEAHLIRNSTVTNHGITANLFTNAGADCYLVIRSDATFLNCLLVGIAVGGAVSCYHKVAGTYTQFSGPAGLTVTSGDKIRALIVGTKICFTNLTKVQTGFVDVPAGGQGLNGTYVGVRYSGTTAATGNKSDNVEVWAQATS